MPTGKYVSASEIQCHCGCGQGVDEVSQRLLDLLDLLRENIGGPLNFNCIYRCPEHNAAVNGVDNSQHVLGTAADIATPSWLTTAEFKWYVFNCHDDQGGFDGIGVYAYDSSCNTKGDGFIHVDIRDGGCSWGDDRYYWEDLG